MNLYVISLIILSVAPAIFLGAYIYKKDVYEKESTGLLTRLFLAGIASAILTLFLSEGLSTIFPFFLSEAPILSYSLFELFLYVFIGVALIEEFSKWLLVKTIAWKNKEFNYLYDAIVYCVFVSLGFATLENILYALQISTAKNILLRGILAIPCHAFVGVFMGYFLGRAKANKINNNKKACKKDLFFSILVPTCLHGTYDYLLYAMEKYPDLFLAFVTFMIFLYIFSFIYIKEVSKDSYSFINIDTAEKNRTIPTINQQFICPACLQEVEQTAIFCKNCGHKLK